MRRRPDPKLGTPLAVGLGVGHRRAQICFAFAAVVVGFGCAGHIEGPIAGDRDAATSLDAAIAADAESLGVDAGDPANCSQSPIQCDETDLPLVNSVAVEAPGTGGCSPGMLRVDTFCIDRYEAMLVEVVAGDELAPWSPYAHPGDRRMRAMSIAGAVPQGYVTQIQATAACAEAGKRLCTDSQWLRACQGAAQTTFPYGDEREPGVCNDARTCHPVVQFFESSADWIWSELGHPCINQLPAGLARGGEYAACVSEDGALDMMGNLHEWTADPNGTFRGGFYVDTVINGPGCLYRTTAHNVYHWDYSTGFRCCADPP